MFSEIVIFYSDFVCFRYITMKQDCIENKNNKTYNFNGNKI